MSRRLRCLIAAVMVGGLGLSTGVAEAANARLKQFKVPTANSEPRDITNGSDGNRWFIAGTEFTEAPAKIGRVTPAGDITEFAPDAAAGCNFCILTDIASGADGTLYVASNDPTLIRFDVATGTFLTPIQMPQTDALGGKVAIRGDDVWVSDHNNDVVWRYSLTTAAFASYPVSDPADVAVDAGGNAWFAGRDSAGGNLGRIDVATGEVTRFPTTTVTPRSVAVAPDGQVWFTARFTPQGVGVLDPTNGSVTIYPLDNVGPQGIAASPDGTVWFTQETKGNVASISNAGVIVEAKVVKGSEPAGITVAPDGDPWYSMRAADKIATLQFS